MFLKSLELNGFKSFASRTVLEFPAGITAIVGPNGSGKSNIIDCIRWLLGEREAKNLRGAKVEDLIWNGTPKRPRVGMAQAGLHFDNGSGFFPVDFKEVAIGRRVSRDGQSEYFLNKSEVRLKDIVDFFSRSRLGTKGLTVIGQGSSDLFVRATPEERRLMIEEILGLREYQIKKTEAERKLKNTGFNLEKARAMIEEVLPRLRLLKRQTNKWSKRVALSEELRQMEDNYFSLKLGDIDRSETEIEPKLKSIEASIQALKAEVRGLESEIREIESQPREYEEIKNIKKEQAVLFAERNRIEKELGRVEARLEFAKREASAGSQSFEAGELLGLVGEIKRELEAGMEESNIDKFRGMAKKIIVRISDFLSGRDGQKEIGKDFGEIESLREGLVLKARELEDKFKEMEAKEAKITKGLEDFNRQFQKIFEAIDAKRRRLGVFEEERSKMTSLRERLEFRKGELKNQMVQAGRGIDEFKSDPYARLGEAEFLNLEKKMFRLRGELGAIGEIDETLIKEAEEVENHYNFLESQSKDLDSAREDLKKLIKDLSEKIHNDFNKSLKLINEEFNKFFRLMFGGGSAKLRIMKREARSMKQVHEEGSETEGGRDVLETDDLSGIEIDLSLPKKRITGLEMLSGGEKSLVSIAALFSLISVSPPPFLVLDEIDAALDESNSRRFANLVKEFSKKTQFIIATHNRATMEGADVLYGVTMGEDGASKVLSLKLE
ncbi:AAA family ATPase [Candidatus Wolfebacteria bacterium]|nr:AAA family ATPase [Candidatus Wolfebacteria bacterium]